MRPRTSVGRDFQDSILERLVARRQITTIYLRNRMALRGRIREFDPYVLLLEPLDGTPIQMVYKSAVVSVSGPPNRRRRPDNRTTSLPGGPPTAGRGPGMRGGPAAEPP